MIDEVANLGNRNPEEIRALMGETEPKEGFLESVSGWLPLTVTWGGISPYCKDFEWNDSNGNHGLAVRILLS